MTHVQNVLSKARVWALLVCEQVTNCVSVCECICVYVLQSKNSLLQYTCVKMYGRILSKYIEGKNSLIIEFTIFA